MFSKRVVSLIAVTLAFKSTGCLASQARVPGSQSQHSRVPVIDLSLPDEEIVPQIRDACEQFGFFQVVNHSVGEDVMTRFRNECRIFFEEASAEKKQALRRSVSNARGYFDDELTKQKRDWKEAIDIGMPYSREWSLPDKHESNNGLDGYNLFPENSVSATFRSAYIDYFEECERLADRLAILMAKGLGAEDRDDTIVQDLRDHHTSYLRTNFYPPLEETEKDGSTLGISPHNDAGFLTVLLQDDDCHSLQVNIGDTGTSWETVHPVPGGLTINTGDMAQVWSNGRFRAPSHRVLTSSKKRYSMPFFYNPGYETWVRPINNDTAGKRYHPVLWGYFRAVRFAGDFTDLGAEIQVADYETNAPTNSHLQRQRAFWKMKGCQLPFSVKAYRRLLRDFPE